MLSGKTKVQGSLAVGEPAAAKPVAMALPLISALESIATALGAIATGLGAVPAPNPVFVMVVGAQIGKIAGVLAQVKAQHLSTT